jgi:hypothetical protein
MRVFGHACKAKHVLCGCETGSLKLRVFEYRVLWNVFVPESEEITGGWRKLRNERASYYVLHNIVRVSWPRVGAIDHDHGNDPPSSIKCGEFLDWRRRYWILRKHSALWN